MKLMKKISKRTILFILTFIFIVIMLSLSNFSKQANGGTVYPTSTTLQLNSSIVNVGDSLEVNVNTTYFNGLFDAPVDSGVIVVNDLYSFENYSLFHENLYSNTSPNVKMVSVMFQPPKGSTLSGLKVLVNSINTLSDLTWQLSFTLPNDSSSNIISGSYPSSTVNSINNEYLYLFFDEDIYVDDSRTYYLTLNTSSSIVLSARNASSSSMNKIFVHDGTSWSETNLETSIIGFKSRIIDSANVSGTLPSLVENWIIPADSPGGYHDIVAYYTNGSTYEPSLDSRGLYINQTNLAQKITVSNLTVEYSDVGILEISTFTETNDPIPNVNVTLYKSNDTLTWTCLGTYLSDSNGKIHVSWEGTSPGTTWTVKAINTNGNYTTEGIGKVQEIKESIGSISISAMGIIGTSSMNSTASLVNVNVTILDNDAEPVQVGFLAFWNENGSKTLLDTQYTNSSGICSFNFDIDKYPGTWINALEIETIETTKYYGFSAVNDVLILKGMPVVTNITNLSGRVSDEVSISFLVQSEAGIVLPGITFSVRYLDDGTWYSLGNFTTNNSGIATVSFGTFDAKKTVLVEINTFETTWWNPTIQAFNLTINEEKTRIDNVANMDYTFVHGQEDTFQVILVDDEGNPLQGETLYLYFTSDPNLVEWDYLAVAVSNSSGVVTFVFVMDYDVNYYIIPYYLKVEYIGSTQYLPSSKIFSIDVVPAPTEISIVSPSNNSQVLINETLILEGYLLDNETNPVPGEQVEININGMQWGNITTSSEGHFLVKLTLNQAGPIEITLVFEGTDNHVRSNITLMLNVSKLAPKLQIINHHWNNDGSITLTIGLMNLIGADNELPLNLKLYYSVDNSSWLFISNISLKTDLTTITFIPVFPDTNSFYFMMNTVENQIYAQTTVVTNTNVGDESEFTKYDAMLSINGSMNLVEVNASEKVNFTIVLLISINEMYWHVYNDSFSMTITIDNTTLYETILPGGTSTISLEIFVPSGNYTLKFVVKGNSLFNRVEGQLQLHVNPMILDARATIPETVEAGESFNITLELQGVNPSNQALKINFYLNDTLVKTLFLQDNQTFFDLTINTAGTWYWKIEIDGNGWYENKTLQGKIVVIPNPELSPDDANKDKDSSPLVDEKIITMLQVIIPAMFLFSLLKHKWLFDTSKKIFKKYRNT